MFGDLSYTGKDIISLREDIMNYIREHDPNFTDYNESSLQMQYVDICAGVVDLMCYYLDNQALETYLPTARQEKNIRSIMKTLNYELPVIGPAQGYVWTQRQDQDEEGSYSTDEILIPKYTTIYSGFDAKAPKYLTAEETFFKDTDIRKKIPIVQGTYNKITIPVSTVSDSYKLYITDKEVPLDYIKIEDEEWVKVDDAFKEIKGGKKYSTHCDSKGRCYILFTYNWREYLSKEADATMEISYIETLGRGGIVSAYTLDTFGDGIKDITTGESAKFYIRVWNSEPTFGAFDKPDLNKQKANALNWLQTYDRLVTLADFDTMLRKEPWVVDCYVADWRTNGKLVQYPHEAKAWIVPIDGNIPILDDKFTELQNKIQEKTVMMTSIHVLPAAYKEVEWTFRLRMTGASEADKERIRKEVEDLLKRRYTLSAFCNGNEESQLKFNMEVRSSAIEATVYNYSDAIVDIELPFTEDFRLAENEFLDVKSLVVEIIE